MKLTLTLAASFLTIAALNGAQPIDVAQAQPFDVAQGQQAAPVAPPAQPGTTAAITEGSIRGHMEFLASDALNGRGSGTRDEWIAAEYIASQLRRWGLEPLGDRSQGQPRSFVQRIEMRAVETTAPPTLTAGGVKLTHGKEMVVQSLGSIAVASGPLMKYAAGKIVSAGAIVLLPHAPTAPTPAPNAPPSPEAQAAAAADRAALALAAVVITIQTDANKAAWTTAASKLPSAAPRVIDLPATSGMRATRLIVDPASYAALAATREGATMLFNADTKWGDTPTYTWNVLAQLTGSDATLRRDIVLLSAHLDHVGMQPNAKGDDKIFNGADDDASGSVAVLELAKALMQGPRPKRTIAFAWFGSEERGGHGSNYFAETTPLGGVIANLQFEMIGRPDPKVPAQTLWLTGYERSNLGPELAKRGARLVQDPHPDQSFFTRSDNIRFARKGIPAHTVSSFGLHSDYHQPGDEVRRIDFPHMTEAIRSMLEPIRWLVNDTFKPEWTAGGRPR